MTEREGVRAAAFEFARRLADTNFRNFLRDHGYRSQQDVIVALDDETVEDVLRRVVLYSRPPAMIAIRRRQEHKGFVFLALEPARRKEASDEITPLAHSTSIGMLYDNMANLRNQFDPNAWFSVHRIDGELATR